MQLQLPYYDYDLKVSQKDKNEIDQFIEASLREFRMQKDELEELVLECVSNISNSSSISAELSEQGVLKRLWGDISGRNRKLHSALDKSAVNVQYAQQQILCKLIQLNASMMNFAVAIQKETHTITLDISRRLFETDQQLKRACIRLIEQRDAIVRVNEAQEQICRELDNVVFICPRCRTFVKRSARICHKCGHLIHTEENRLTTQEGSEWFRQNLEGLSNLIQEIHTVNNIISDHKLDWYQQKSRQIRHFVDKANFPEDIRHKVMEKCAGFESILENQHIEIAIAGTVKAGKSSLINALLDTEFATVDATPETSVLAKYRTTSGESYLKVRFFSEDEWRQIWKDARKSSIYMDEYLKLRAGAKKKDWVGHDEHYKLGFDIPTLQKELSDFISSKSPVHFFVKDVEVGIHSDLFPHDVYLVDTPGLDDVVAARSNVTRKYLGSANAVLACIKEKDIHEASEATFVSRVMANMRKWNALFVIATQKDLDKPSDYGKNRDYFVEKVLNPMLNPSNSGALHGTQYRGEQHFFGISAKMYTYALAYEKGDLIGEDYNHFLSMLIQSGFMDFSAISEHLEDIRKESGIPLLKQSMENRLFKSTRQNLYAKMDEAFQDFLKQIHDIMEAGMEMLSERLDLLTANENDLAALRAKAAEVEQHAAELENYIGQLRTIIYQGGGQ